jgi:hypothetical protein
MMGIFLQDREIGFGRRTFSAPSNPKETNSPVYRGAVAKKTPNSRKRP